MYKSTPIKEDIVTLNDISKTTIDRLFDIVTSCICFDLHEALLSKENCVDIDIGFGKLLMQVSDKGIRYKFIPSKTLEQGLQQVVERKEDPLQKKLEKSLSEKLLAAYKDFF